ncbi:hypothetical protein DFJ74DRAFT_99818 [Hyaloraphidium curvatum]|nr:hypothetical protein DFJ74DRAFT_99818 [Hyaloraphidium curvatum]
MVSTEEETTSKAPKPGKPGLRERLQPFLIAFVVLPLSFLSARLAEIWGLPARWKRLRLAGSDSGIDGAHAARVRRVADSVKAWNALPADSRPPIRTDRSEASSHSVRAVQKGGALKVPMGDLCNILSLDKEARTVTVEPFVTVGDITTYLLSHGFMLEATLEMEDATIGGLALSQGMTTHSHQCGLVHDTVTEFELVSGSGEVIRATPTENEDVYRAAGFSHGSLGFVTSLTLRVVPAEQELLVTYRTYTSIAALSEAYEKEIADPDSFFLEAFIFSLSHAVIVRGDLIDQDGMAKLSKEGVPRNFQGRWYKAWYFSHARDVPDGHRELMPMRDYLMRHDKAMCMSMLTVWPIGNHPLIRWTMGWMLPPKITFLKGLRPPEVRVNDVVGSCFQDLAFPREKLQDMVELVDRELSIFPLLVYPALMIDRGGFIRHPGKRGSPAPPEHESRRHYLNLGIYGVPRGVREGDSNYDTLAAVRRVLAAVRSFGGFQHSYCDVLQTEEEFKTMFDHTLAEQVRKRIGSDNLPWVYQKVRVEVPWEEWIEAK